MATRQEPGASFDRTANGGAEFLSRSFGDDREEGAAGLRLAPALDRHRDHRLVRDSAPPLSAAPRASDVRLVGLDVSAQKLMRPPCESGAELVQHRPSRLGAAEAEITLELEHRDALLVARHEEDRQEPFAQRDPGAPAARSRQSARPVCGTLGIAEASGCRGTKRADSRTADRRIPSASGHVSGTPSRSRRPGIDRSPAARSSTRTTDRPGSPSSGPRAAWSASA